MCRERAREREREGAREGERKRERESKRARERERERGKDRKTDRQTDRQKDQLKLGEAVLVDIAQRLCQVYVPLLLAHLGVCECVCARASSFIKWCGGPCVCVWCCARARMRVCVCVFVQTDTHKGQCVFITKRNGSIRRNVLV
jgi:hypothetical protein